MTAGYRWPASGGLSCCTHAGRKQTAFTGRRYKSCGLARATLVRSKFSVGRRCWVRAGCRARFGLHRTLDDAEVVPPIEPKAVLEHRAPKTSTPILHSRGVESKVGRAVHCAPVAGWSLQSRLPGPESCFPRPHGRAYEVLVYWCWNKAANSGWGGQRTMRCSDLSFGARLDCLNCD